MPKLSASYISSPSIAPHSTNCISNGNTAVLNSTSILFLHPVYHRPHLHDKSPSPIPSRYFRPNTQSSHTHAITFQPMPTTSAPVFTLSKAVPPKSTLSPPSSQLYTLSSGLQSQTPSTHTPLPPSTLSSNTVPTPNSSTVSSPPSLPVHPRNRKKTSYTSRYPVQWSHACKKDPTRSLTSAS